ncbi:MAG: DUF4115 domain-containing protein [Actinobacteria bacterium]|nr:DUF4115 domain-containing protein [Actinomycetota bacterium]
MFEIGSSLREARQRRGLDLPACERETKIRAKYLRAMEDDEFETLPAPTYVRGFLKTYAEFLGLDGRLVIDEYESRHLPLRSTDGDVPRGPDGLARTPRRRPSRRPRRPEANALAALAFMVLAVSTVVYSGFGGDTPSPPVPPTASTPDLGVVPVPPSRTTPRRVVPPSRIRVTMTGLGPDGSYVQVRVRGATGRVVFEGPILRGAVRSYTVRKPLWVRVGQTAGVALRVNGTARPWTGGTANFLITAAGATPVS